MRKLSIAVVLLAVTAAPALADKRLDDCAAKADELFRKNRPEEAAKCMQKLATQDPSNPELHRALGRILMRVGQRDEAGAAFERAAQVAEAAPAAVKAVALSNLASYELLRGAASKALTHADAAVKAEANATTLAILAEAQVRNGKATAGLATADRALSVDASSAVANEAKGFALLALERFDEAIAAMRKATGADPSSVAAKVGLAGALLAADKATEAIEVARAATVADQKSAEAFAVLGAAIAKANPNAWSDAIAETQNGAFLDPKSPLVQFHVGQLFEQNGNYDQALPAYHEAIKTDPNYTPAAMAIVLATWRKGDPDGALKAAEHLVKFLPECGRLQLTIGELKLRKEDYAGATPALEAAVRLLPNSPEANYFLGLADAYQLKFPEAVTAYARAVQLKPADLEYRVAYAFALGRVDRNDEGVAQLQKVVASPEYKGVDAWVNLGLLYRTMTPRKPAEAADAYKKALSIDPKNSPAALGFALATAQAGRWDEASASFQNAARIDPTLEAVSAVQIARCVFMRDYQGKKGMNEAEAAYQKAVALAGADNEVLKTVRNNIDTVNKGGKEIDTTADTFDPNEQIRILMSKAGTGAKIRAVNALKSMGRDGAPLIAAYGSPIRQDDFDVSLAAVRALDSMKGAACGTQTLREVKMIAFMEMPVPSPDAKRAEVEREMKLGDVIRAAKQLYNKLQGMCR